MANAYKCGFYRIIILFVVGLISTTTFAQNNYKVVEVISTNSSKVCFDLKVYGNSKKTIGQDAAIAAVKAVMFEGIEGTAFSKPLLPQGERTCVQQYPVYFTNLFNTTYADFVTTCTMKSKFKKADDDKSTLFEVEVKVIQLRRDLEKNKIKTKIAL